MKEILAQLQSGIDLLGSFSSDDGDDDEDSSSGLASALQSLKDALADYDADNTDNEEVSRIFNEAKQTIEQARPQIRRFFVSRQAHLISSRLLTLIQ